MRAADPEVIIALGKIYRALGKAADCGGCMPLFLDTMRGNDRLKVAAQLSNLRSATAQGLLGSEEYSIEGRSESYRLPK